MMERNEAGKKIRRYLIEVEKRFRAQQQAEEGRRLGLAVITTVSTASRYWHLMAVSFTSAVVLGRPLSPAD